MLFPPNPPHSIFAIPSHPISANDAISRLWQTLLAGKVELKPIDGVTVAVLPDGVKWLTESRSELFIRPCNKNIYEMVRKRLNGTPERGVVITGNPGIGKSWSLCYFLMELAKEEKPRTVVFESVALDKMWVFRSDGTTSVIDGPRTQTHPPEFDDPHTVYLFDTAGDAPREPLQVNAYTVVASSPNRANYKQFHKRVRSKIYLPCWSLDELKCVLEFFPHITDKVLDERFLQFGGIPRYVLPPPDDLAAGVSEIELDIAIKQCNLQSILDSAGDIEVPPHSIPFPFDNTRLRFVAFVPAFPSITFSYNERSFVEPVTSFCSTRLTRAHTTMCKFVLPPSMLLSASSLVFRISATLSSTISFVLLLNLPRHALNLAVDSLRGTATSSFARVGPLQFALSNGR